MSRHSAGRFPVLPLQVGRSPELSFGMTHLRALPELPDSCHAQIDAMDYRDAAATSQRTQQLAAALDDADRFAPPEAALQTRQLLGAIRCVA